MLLKYKVFMLLANISPIAWFVGSTFFCCRDRQSAFIWRRRCTIVATLILTGFIIAVIVVMVAKPSLFGLRSSSLSSEVSASPSDQKVHGVPIANSSDWSDTVAGISIGKE